VHREGIWLKRFASTGAGIHRLDITWSSSAPAGPQLDSTLDELATLVDSTASPPPTPMAVIPGENPDRILPVSQLLPGKQHRARRDR